MLVPRSSVKLSTQIGTFGELKRRLASDLAKHEHTHLLANSNGGIIQQRRLVMPERKCLVAPIFTSRVGLLNKTSIYSDKYYYTTLNSPTDSNANGSNNGTNGNNFGKINTQNLAKQVMAQDNIPNYIITISVLPDTAMYHIYISVSPVKIDLMEC